jgi:hypothetical protein
MKDAAIKIQAPFHGRLTTISLAENFYELNENETGIIERAYRTLYATKLSEDEFAWVIGIIKAAIAKAEPLVAEYFAAKQKETDEPYGLEPLYSLEFDHYDVDVDVLSYGLNNNNNQAPALEFDIIIDCMDKDDQHIFLYDSRGTCTVGFEVNHLDGLRVTEVS